MRTNNAKGLYLKLNKVKDADILEALESLGNKQGYIKALIRHDLKKSKVGLDSFICHFEKEA